MIRLNAHVPVANLVMAYYDAEVEEYAKVRDYVCWALNLNNCVYHYSSGAGLSMHRIFYMNPSLDAVAEARVVIFLEAHHGASRQQNAIACQQLMRPDSLVLAESTKSITVERAPLAGIAREAIIKNYQLLPCPEAQFSGWDYFESPTLTYYKTVAEIHTRVTQLQQRAEENAEEIDLVNAQIDLLNDEIERASKKCNSAEASLKQALLSKGNQAVFVDFSLRNQHLVRSIACAVTEISLGKIKGKAMLFTGVAHIRYSDFPKNPFFEPIVASVIAVQAFLKTCRCVVLYPLALEHQLALMADIEAV